MATVNQVYPLSLQLAEREQTLYPRVHIFISSQEINQSPREATHFISGAYYSQFTPSSEAYYLLQWNVYSDSGYTTLSADYGSVMDQVKVDSTETDAAIAAAGGGGGGSAYISSQLDYISSQVGFISGNQYNAGGGGRNYNVYTKKSPWTHAQKNQVISGMKSAISKVDSLTQDTSDYHDNQMLEIGSSRDNILNRIDSVLGSLSTVKKDVRKTSKSKDVDKILNDLSFTIKTLSEYKKEFNKLSSSEETQLISNDVILLKKIMAKYISDEELEELVNE